MMQRRQWLAGTATVLMAGGAWSADDAAYPKGPVKIIIPFPPGGPTDTVGRLIAQQLQDAWKQTVLVDYKPGAGTVIGVDYVVLQPPDGQTIGMVNSSLAVNPSLRPSMPYKTPESFAAITQIASLQLALVSRPDAPFGNLAELIAYAKKNPGKLVYGTPGAGSTTHLGMGLFKRETGIDMLHAPFKGSAPAHTELLGGRIDLVCDPFLSVIQYVKSGRMKMICTLGERKVTGYDYPVAADTLPNFTVSALLGFIAPAGTPKPVLKKIQVDTTAALNAPELRKRFEDYGMTVVGSTPEQFETLTQPLSERDAKAINAAMNEHAVLVSRRDSPKNLSNFANQLWHSDSSFMRPRAAYSMLHAVVTPSWGGNTEFADLRAAYDALDARTRADVQGLSAEHYALHTRLLLGDEAYTDAQKQAIDPAVWPLVDTHPGSGRKLLFVGVHARQIVGWPTAESRMFLADLLEHATQRERVYVHHWQPGDLVIWDNRSTLHRGRRYDIDERRELRRTTINDVPQARLSAA